MKRLGGLVAALRSGEGLKSQLLRGGIGSLGVKIISTGLNLALAIVLARLLGPKGFGVYSFILAVVTILAIPAQLGLPNLVVRETAKAQATEDWALMKGLWRWVTLMALVMSGILVVLGATGALLFVDQSSLLKTFWWALALIPLIALGNLRGAVLRGLRYVVLGQLPEFVLRPLFLTLLPLLIIVSGTILTPELAMIMHVVAAALSFAVGTLLLMSVMPRKITSERRWRTNIPLWLSSTLPLALFSGIHVANMNIGVIATGLLSTEEDVGFLRIALQGATFVSFGLSAANMVVAPYIAQMLGNDNNERLQSMLTISARLVTLLSIPVIVVYLVVGRQIISILLGQEFAMAYLPLVILSFGYFWNALMASNDVLLNMAGLERVALKGLILGTLANCVICLILVPIIGGLGAAIAYSLSLVIWNTYLWIQARRFLRLDTSAIALPLAR